MISLRVTLSATQLLRAALILAKDSGRLSSCVAYAGPATMQDFGSAFLVHSFACRCLALPPRRKHAGGSARALAFEKHTHKARLSTSAFPDECTVNEQQ
eukprot:406642-Amphidinium_carterae.2